MVTAEAALTLPCVALALLGALSLAGAGAAKVACTDAAGSAARSLSRGDSIDRARAVALAAAPGATVSWRRTSDEVVVEVRRRVRGRGLLAGVTVTVGARAVGVPERGEVP
jgi:Flp pilus assembly protein TadG